MESKWKREGFVTVLWGWWERGKDTVSKSMIKTQMLSQTQDKGMEEKITC